MSEEWTQANRLLLKDSTRQEIDLTLTDQSRGCLRRRTVLLDSDSGAQ